jgi:hypothetical protein
LSISTKVEWFYSLFVQANSYYLPAYHKAQVDK